MKQEDIHRRLLQALGKKIPDKTALVEMLTETLFLEKGAVYRRLRGEVPFSFFEVVNIAEKLNIPLNKLVYADSVKTDRFELNIIEYANPSDADYKEWDDYISLIRSAKNDPRSEIAVSSTILPLLIYGKFDALSKYFLLKYQYSFSGTESRISFNNLVFPERLNRIYHSYCNESRNFAKTIFIWDPLIFRYLVTDILFFSDTKLISKEDMQQIKKDLFALLNYVEAIAFQGYFEETGNSVDFYISDVNLNADYSYLQFNDTHICRIRTLILNSIVSPNPSSFGILKNWILSLKKSSTLITRSGAVYRTDFFEKQRKIISEL